MGQPSEDDQDTQDWLDGLFRDTERSQVEYPLRHLGVSEERALYLSYHNNVLKDLPNASADEWDLAFAAAAQISTYGYPGVDREKLQEEVLGHIERLVSETVGDRPSLLLKTNSLQSWYEDHPRWGTYIYSRICKAEMMGTDHEQAIKLYEDIQALFHEDEYIDPETIVFSVREKLVPLYQTVGRYEEAMWLLLLHHYSLDYPVETLEWGDFIVDTLKDWLERLTESAEIAEVKRFLDLIIRVDDHIYEHERGLYELQHRFVGLIAALEEQNFASIPEDIRRFFRASIIESHQYWAWFYGNSLGKLLVQRPGLRQSLLEELEAGEWSEGWPAGGVLFESTPSSWDEYRQRALKLYSVTDMEYRYHEPYMIDPEIENSLEHDTSSIERQPPHLSSESDLYWIMRVGFADAYIKSGAKRSASPQEFADIIDQVRGIVSSAALRTLRIDTKLEELSGEISRGLPPTEEYWREILRQVLASVYDDLPEQTISHLTMALDRRHAKDPDGQRVAIGRAVESIFHELVIDRIKRAGEDGITIIIQQRGNTTQEHRLDGRYTFQMSEWAQILGTVGHSRDGSPFEWALNKAFSKVDVRALGRLSEDLREMSRLRGRASHHARDSAEWKTERADELWAAVVGGADSAGFIERFCTALGLMERETKQHGKE